MDQDTSTLTKALLGIGFVALAVGVMTAYTNPASSYEISIYTHTPIGFWIGILLATGVSIIVSLFAAKASIRILGLGLAVAGFTAFAGLPIIRNYHFYGTADAMTHLGWTRSIVAGEMDLLSLLYPGIHTGAALIAELTGYPVPRALMYVVVIFAVLFIVSMALSAWALTHYLRPTAVAAFSAMMLLPITNVSSQLVAHPTTQVLLFTPLVFYLLLRYLRSSDAGLSPTAPGVILAVVLVAFVLYHPQQALNLLGVFIAFATLQFLVRRWRSDTSPVAATRPVYAQTGILAVAFALWAPGHSRFDASFNSGIIRLQQLLAGESQIAAETTERGASLAQLGSGLLEIFLKLFAVASFYSIATGILLLVILAGRLDDDDTLLPSFGRLMIVGFVPVVGIILLYLAMASGFGTQWFRHVGLIMVFITLLGAIAIARGWDAFDRSFGTPAMGSVVTVVLLVGLVVSTATVFPSPWIYLHNQHVSEMQMDGYEAGFEYVPNESRFFNVRGGPDRFGDVHNVEIAPKRFRYRSMNETGMLGNLSRLYGDDWYFSLTRRNYEQEVFAHKGLRYSAQSFDAARNQHGVNRVIDNGGFELYYVSE